MARQIELERWFRGKIEELSDETTNKKLILVEVKSGIGALDEESRKFLARSVDLNTFFSLLQSVEKDIVESATDVLYMLLNSLPDVEALSGYSACLPQALSNESSHVKRSFLKLLQGHLNAESLVLLSAQRPEILKCVIDCLACPDRGIAEGAVVFFKKIGMTLQGIQLLYSNNFLGILKRTMEVDAVCRFRIYEIAVDIAINSSEGLQAGHTTGLLPALLNEVRANDMLVQLNALELLTNLTANKDGLLYLQREGVIKYLVNRIVNIQQESLSFILLPGLIEFFGNLYKLQPSVFSQQHPEVFQLLFESFETVDPALLGVVTTTLGKIGSSDEGKWVLVAQGDKVKSIFAKLGTIITRKDELCVSAMNTLSVLVRTNNAELENATESWFDALGPQALDTVAGTSKLPFVELRLSALNLLNAISSQLWGVRKVCLSPGLLEFLFDRNAEFDKHCKHSKYEVVQTLAAHPAISTVVTGDILLKLRQFVNEGPYYIPTEPGLAFEGAS